MLPRGATPEGHHIRRLNPPKLLAAGFVCLIVLGTVLLKTPWAHRAELSWLDAMFTATSAVTVTGLAVTDTATFTLFGQLVILALIQLGGIGFMTLAVLMAAALGFRFGLRQQLVAQQALNQPALNTVTQAAFSIGAMALIVEACGLVLLACFFVPERGWSQGLYQSFFYAVSAFNNAGFALSANGLEDFAGRSGPLLVLATLAIIGGLGYMVVAEVLRERRFFRLSLYSKLILLSTGGVCAAGFILFFALEFNNPQTLGAAANWGDRLLAAVFHGAVPRTAGFSTLQVADFGAATCVMFLLLMFIGGAPNSTASGIKLSTFVVMLAATRSFIQGNRQVRLGRHSLGDDVVIRALAITTLSMMAIFVAILIMSAIETAPFLDIAFEAVSAFGTTGMSRGLTGDLSAASQVIVMALMLLGRLGPLTLGYLLTMPEHRQVRYARTDLPVG